MKHKGTITYIVKVHLIKYTSTLNKVKGCTTKGEYERIIVYRVY